MHLTKKSTKPKTRNGRYKALPTSIALSYQALLVSQLKATIMQADRLKKRTRNHVSSRARHLRTKHVMQAANQARWNTRPYVTYLLD